MNLIFLGCDMNYETVISQVQLHISESNITDSEPEVAKKRSTRGAKTIEETPPVSKRVAKLKNDKAEESSGR